MTIIFKKTVIVLLTTGAIIWAGIFVYEARENSNFLPQNTPLLKRAGLYDRCLDEKRCIEYKPTNTPFLDSENIPKPWAIFVVPDTQDYTQDFDSRKQHLLNIFKWVCENRSGWVEPSSGKEVDILAVVSVGDMVNDGGDTRQWKFIDHVYKTLDECDGGVIPYLTIVGNHDYDTLNISSEASGFDKYFGLRRFERYTDTQEASDPSKWYVGRSPDIKAFSRTVKNEINIFKKHFPWSNQPGRMSAISIISPNQKSFLLVGLEFGMTKNDLEWPIETMNTYLNIPTIVIRHNFFTGGTDLNELEYSDEKESVDPRELLGSNEIWKTIANVPQVFMTINGRNLPGEQVRETKSGKDVISIARDFQYYMGNGLGWVSMIVFDPNNKEIRIRDYRISNTTNPVITHTDLDGNEKVFQYDF